MSQFDSSMSSKSMMQTVLFNRLNKDPGEEKTNSMLLVTVATDAVSDVAAANRSSSEGTVQSLSGLIQLGFDKDDDIVKDMLETDTAIRKSFKTIADVIPQLLR
jgi:hypothetical protein